MSLYEFALTETLKSLQRSADRCATTLSNSVNRVEYRILYAAGDRHPWRLIEVLRAVRKPRQPALKRRLHCFESSSKLSKSLSERTLWKLQDRALVRTHLLSARSALDQGAPGADAQTAEQAIQGLDADLRALEPDRRRLKDQMCRTHADRLIELVRRA